MDDSKRKMLCTYFSPFPTWSGWLILVPAVLIFASGIQAGITLLALIPLGAGLYLMIRWFKRPTDEQVDVWLQEDLRDLEDRALEKSFLVADHQVRDPVTLTGPRFRQLGGAVFSLLRGVDHKVRFTPVNVTVINFTQHHLSIYQCALDLTTGAPLNESVEKFFYRDVVSLKKESRSITVERSQLHSSVLKTLEGQGASPSDQKLQINGGEELVLVTSAGTSIRIFLQAPVIVQAAGGGEIPEEESERAIRTVDKNLWEMKAQSDPYHQSS